MSHRRNYHAIFPPIKMTMYMIASGMCELEQNVGFQIFLNPVFTFGKFHFFLFYRILCENCNKSYYIIETEKQQNS